MSRRFDVIVVGVGTMGSAACYHLARRGVSVLGLERFQIPNDRSSHHGHSRVIRKAYFEHPDYVPLLERAYDGWAELEAVSDQKLFYRTGGIYLGRLDSELITGSLLAMRRHGLAHEQLSPQQLRDRYPQFTVPDDFVGLYDADTGFLLAELAVAVTAEQALRHGAELRVQEGVVGWLCTSACVTVQTDQETYEADRVVFCGGPWASRLLEPLRSGADLGSLLKVTRQVVAWVWPHKPKWFGYGTLPVWGIDAGWGGLHYGVPMMPERPGLKVAFHKIGKPVDPDRPESEPMAADEATFRPVLQNYMPAANGPCLSLTECLYTNTPDGHFIIDCHPADERVVFACGFSGHGFKFATVVGEVLADLAMNGGTDQPIGFLGLSRFD